MIHRPVVGVAAGQKAAGRTDARGTAGYVCLCAANAGGLRGTAPDRLGYDPLANALLTDGRSSYARGAAHNDDLCALVPLAVLAGWRDVDGRRPAQGPESIRDGMLPWRRVQRQGGLRLSLLVDAEAQADPCAWGSSATEVAATPQIGRSAGSQ